MATELRFKITGTLPLNIEDAFEKADRIAVVSHHVTDFKIIVSELGGVVEVEAREVTPRARGAAEATEPETQRGEDQPGDPQGDLRLPDKLRRPPGESA